MAKKKDQTEERIEAVEQALSKTERFIEDHQNIILSVIGVIVLIILGFLGYTKFYLNPLKEEAQEQMFMAEKYFEKDSLDLALYGDGNNLGFLDIIDEYGATKSASLAQYYAGISFLKKGEYENAIDHLEDYEGDDYMLKTLAIGAIGDAYVELEDIDNGLDYYLKAANRKENEFTTPPFLMKAAWANEELGDYEEAIELYKRLKKEYPNSIQAREVDKYIARLEEMVQNT